jgi:transposase-like protein
MGRKIDLTNKEKTELVLAMIRKDDTTAELSRKYGVSESVMYKWRDEFIASGSEGLKPKRSAGERDELKRMQKKIDEHKLVIGEYAFANDILKKKLDGLI